MATFIEYFEADIEAAENALYETLMGSEEEADAKANIAVQEHGKPQEYPSGNG